MVGSENQNGVPVAGAGDVGEDRERWAGPSTGGLWTGREVQTGLQREGKSDKGLVTGETVADTIRAVTSLP